jgi:hypothetical protein
MKTERILLLLSILGIFILLILSNFNKPTITGEISKIVQTKNSIQINLENKQGEILVLNKSILPEKIKKGDKIEIYGDKQTNLNKTIIFANKIKCLNC